MIEVSVGVLGIIEIGVLVMVVRMFMLFRYGRSCWIVVLIMLKLFEVSEL